MERGLCRGEMRKKIKVAALIGADFLVQATSSVGARSVCPALPSPGFFPRRSISQCGVDSLPSAMSPSPSSESRRTLASPRKPLFTPGLALLAAVDVGIWSYVGHAVSLRPVVVPKAPLLAMEIVQP
jgi:hypothetical protein